MVPDGSDVARNPIVVLRRRLTIRALVALASAGALALGFAWAPGTGRTHDCVRSNELWFRAADGTKLVGHRFGGEKPGRRTAVVLAHMSEGDLCSWVSYARRLAGHGFFAFPFDFRGYGFSTGREHRRRSPSDIVAAVRVVRALGARKVVVVGASLGGIAALVTAAGLRPPVQGVVSVSGPAAIDGELDARSSVGRLRVPTLYLAARDDRNAPYDFPAEARELYQATATSEKRLVLVPGSLHGTFLVDASSRARAELTRFLRDPAGAVP